MYRAAGKSPNGYDGGACLVGKYMMDSMKHMFTTIAES